VRGRITNPEAPDISIWAELEDPVGGYFRFTCLLGFVEVSFPSAQVEAQAVEEKVRRLE